MIQQLEKGYQITDEQFARVKKHYDGLSSSLSSSLPSSLSSSSTHQDSTRRKRSRNNSGGGVKAADEGLTLKPRNMPIVAGSDNSNQQQLFKEWKTQHRESVSISYADRNAAKSSDAYRNTLVDHTKAHNQNISDGQNERSYVEKRAAADAQIDTMNLRSAMDGATKQSENEQVKLWCGLEGGCGRNSHKDGTIILSTHQYYHRGNKKTHKGLYVVVPRCHAGDANGLQCMKDLIPVDEETEYITTGQLRYDVAKHAKEK